MMTKHLPALAAALLIGNACAAPEAYLSVGRMGDPDHKADFSLAVKSGNTYMRWTAQAPAVDFAAGQPNAVEILEVDPNNRNTVISSRRINVTAASFKDKALYVCTSWYWIGTCAKREYVNYKVLYGTDKIVITKPLQAYMVKFHYTPNGGTPAYAASAMQKVEGLEKYCGEGDTAVGMRVYRPANPVNAPAIVLSHGGFWRDYSPIDMETYAKKLQAAGYFVANVDYRLTPFIGRFDEVWHSLHPLVDWPTFKAQNPLAVQKQAEAEAVAASGVHVSQALGDVKCAIRHLRSNASVYGIDSERIAVMGYSAGAHLSMMAGFAPVNKVPAAEGVGGYVGVPDHVRAIVSLAGPTHLVTAYAAIPQRDLRCDFRAAMGFARGECFEIAKGPDLTADETTVVQTFEPVRSAAAPRTPGLPFLLVQSSTDELLNPAQQADAMMAAIKGAPGGDAKAFAKVYANGTHGSYTQSNLCVNAAANLSIKFLDAYVKGNGTPAEVQAWTTALGAEPTTCK